MAIQKRMRHWKSSLDDMAFVDIECPDILSPDELGHVKAFAALWLKQLNRWSTEAYTASSKKVDEVKRGG